MILTNFFKGSRLKRFEHILNQEIEGQKVEIHHIKKLLSLCEEREQLMERFQTLEKEEQQLKDIVATERIDPPHELKILKERAVEAAKIIKQKGKEIKELAQRIFKEEHYQEILHRAEEMVWKEHASSASKGHQEQTRDFATLKGISESARTILGA